MCVILGIDSCRVGTNKIAAIGRFHFEEAETWLTLPLPLYNQVSTSHGT